MARGARHHEQKTVLGQSYWKSYFCHVESVTMGGKLLVTGLLVLKWPIFINFNNSSVRPRGRVHFDLWSYSDLKIMWEESESPEFRGLWVQSGFHGLKLGTRLCLGGLDCGGTWRLGVGEWALCTSWEGLGRRVSQEEEAPYVPVSPPSRTGAFPLPRPYTELASCLADPTPSGPGHSLPRSHHARSRGVRLGWGDAQLGNHHHFCWCAKVLQTLPCF